MKICIVGGGPAGLYFAILMKQLDPSQEITILERDGPNDTFGWGIVFSDQTFGYLESSDAPSFTRIVESCQTWDNVDIVHHGEKVSIHGNRFSGIARLAFLNILHARCRELGVDVRFGTNITDRTQLPPHDLLVGADGANSLLRQWFSDGLRPTIDRRKNRYIWLGTPRLFHGLTLTFHATEAGPFASHAYKFSETASTFIVECAEETWARAELEGKSGEETCAYLEEVFADDLHGEPLLTNNFVRWINFPLVKNQHWQDGNVVLLGDALHTAHFSIGSGTKLALEDAIALAQAFEANPRIDAALPAFERARKAIVDRLQDAAESSLVWFEQMGDYLHLPPLPFAYEAMTRSGRVDREKLRKRDPKFVAAYERGAANDD
ncbi:MAG: FAD-dependent monooxygenase [Vicinamibacterales bacterium]|jgi:anthraniloyl-CoA monooxygenase|nr:FAD-dependent monooxygenase [Vicinamibacterales bacterium]MDP7294431.1 FAD-dependent monooxygenase [Vicinamibacterales bacterium]MDP7471146.1 FAD-dependent monooxygenase [Vicinamibacterales bacterium]MDP7672498.1 FAD-dependent monooxygenase [Vicinamibacterales bacterium]HJO37069.1 FAD-dependent monooxygenase [Vicinamibacterales bacterium]|tara:strand:+ start:598 stop:1734 length:1137 start_codon:yes stop_codon:yes gene_type:complete